MKYIISTSNIRMDIFDFRREADDVVKTLTRENTTEGRNFRVEHNILLGYFITIYDLDEFEGYFIEVD